MASREPSCDHHPHAHLAARRTGRDGQASAVKPPTDRPRAARRPVCERIRMISARVGGQADDDTDSVGGRPRSGWWYRRSPRWAPSVTDQPGSEGGVHSCSLPGLSPETPNTRGHTEPQSMCLDRWELCCLRGIPAARLTLGGEPLTVADQRRNLTGFPFRAATSQCQRGNDHRNTGARNRRAGPGGLTLRTPLGDEERWVREDRVPAAVRHRNRLRSGPRGPARRRELRMRLSARGP